MTRPNLPLAASGICTSIKSDGHTAVAATSSKTTAKPASPIRTDWMASPVPMLARRGDGVMKTPATPETDWRRRHALSVASMLPDDRWVGDLGLYAPVRRTVLARCRTRVHQGARRNVH